MSVWKTQVMGITFSNGSWEGASVVEKPKPFVDLVRDLLGIKYEPTNRWLLKIRIGQYHHLVNSERDITTHVFTFDSMERAYLALKLFDDRLLEIRRKGK